MRLVTVFVVTSVGLLGTGPASPAPLAAPPIVVLGVQPSDGTAVYVERVSAPWEGGQERWLLNLDVKVRNTGSARLQLRRIELVYPNSSAGTFVQQLGAFNAAGRVAAGGTQTFRATDARMVPLPAPGGVVARLYFRGFDAPLVVGRPLVVWKSSVPGGA